MSKKNISVRVSHVGMKFNLSAEKVDDLLPGQVVRDLRLAKA